MKLAQDYAITSLVSVHVPQHCVDLGSPDHAEEAHLVPSKIDLKTDDLPIDL